MAIKDYLELPEKDLKLVQAKVSEKLLKEVQKKMKSQGVSWNKFFKAACIDYLENK